MHCCQAADMRTEMAVSSLSLSLSKVTDTVGLVLADISLMQHLPPLVAGLCLLLAESLDFPVRSTAT